MANGDDTGQELLLAANLTLLSSPACQQPSQRWYPARMGATTSGSSTGVIKSVSIQKNDELRLLLAIMSLGNTTQISLPIVMKRLIGYNGPDGKALTHYL